jgi:tetratricopeptide (TPR) repeat protein
MCATAAELWLARGDTDRALAYADECIERAVRDDRPKNEVKGRRARGRALIEEGSLREAEEEITRALEQALRIGNPPQIWQSYAALGELRRAQGREDDERAAYGDALAVCERVASRLSDPALRDALLGSDLVASYRRAATGVTE